MAGAAFSTLADFGAALEATGELFPWPRRNGAPTSVRLESDRRREDALRRKRATGLSDCSASSTSAAARALRTVHTTTAKNKQFRAVKTTEIAMAEDDVTLGPDGELCWSISYSMTPPASVTIDRTRLAISR